MARQDAPPETRHPNVPGHEEARTKYTLAMFDFDGTLADSFPFFVSVFNDLAERHRFMKIAPESVSSLRGYSPRQMMRHVGMPAWKLPFVARDFIALMRSNVGAIQPFEGVAALLPALNRAGVGVAIVSSNSRDNVVAVLGADTAACVRHSECGMSIFGKASRIRKVLDTLAVPANEAIYIGDQISDLEASKKAGVAFGAVPWGYGSIESLMAHAPDEVFASVHDILRLAEPKAIAPDVQGR